MNSLSVNCLTINVFLGPLAGFAFGWRGYLGWQRGEIAYWPLYLLCTATYVLLGASAAYNVHIGRSGTPFTPFFTAVMAAVVAVCFLYRPIPKEGHQ